MSDLIVNFKIYIIIHGNWDSAVSTATGHGLDDRGVAVRVPVGSRSLLHVVQTDNGYRG
jgi:hypothetical protein